MTYAAGIAASCSAYHTGLLVLPTSRVRLVGERLEPPDRAGQAAGHGVERGLDHDLDVVLPADGEMLLERGDRVEVGGWAGRWRRAPAPRGPGRSR